MEVNNQVKIESGLCATPMNHAGGASSTSQLKQGASLPCIVKKTVLLIRSFLWTPIFVAKWIFAEALGLKNLLHCFRSLKKYHVNSDGYMIYELTLKEQFNLWMRKVNRLNDASLLEWVNEKLNIDKTGVRVINFSSSWTDGIRLCRLVDAIAPGISSRPDHLSPSNRLFNCRLALTMAKNNLRVGEIIRAEDVGRPSKVCTIKMRLLLQVLRHVDKLRNTGKGDDDVESGSGGGGSKLFAISFRKTLKASSEENPDAGQQTPILRKVLGSEASKCAVTARVVGRSQSGDLEEKNCRLAGVGLMIGLTGKASRFTVSFNSSTKTVCELVVEIKGPRGEHTKEVFKENDLTECGPPGHRLRRSPSIHEALSTSLSLRRPLLQPPLAIPLDVIVLKDDAVKIDSCELHSENWTASAGHDCTCQKGALLFAFTPQTTGRFVIEVQWNGKVVSGSPFKVVILDSMEELKREMHGKILKMKTSALYNFPRICEYDGKSNQYVDGALQQEKRSGSFNRHATLANMHGLVRMSQTTSRLHTVSVRSRKILKRVTTKAGGHEIVLAANQNIKIMSLDVPLEVNKGDFQKGCDELNHPTKEKLKSQQNLQYPPCRPKLAEIHYKTTTKRSRSMPIILTGWTAFDIDTEKGSEKMSVKEMEEQSIEAQRNNERHKNISSEYLTKWRELAVGGTKMSYVNRLKSMGDSARLSSANYDTSSQSTHIRPFRPELQKMTKLTEGESQEIEEYSGPELSQTLSSQQGCRVIDCSEITEGHNEEIKNNQDCKREVGKIGRQLLEKATQVSYNEIKKETKWDSEHMLETRYKRSKKEKKLLKVMMSFMNKGNLSQNKTTELGTGLEKSKFQFQQFPDCVTEYEKDNRRFKELEKHFRAFSRDPPVRAPLSLRRGRPSSIDEKAYHRSLSLGSSFGRHSSLGGPTALTSGDEPPPTSDVGDKALRIRSWVLQSGLRAGQGSRESESDDEGEPKESTYQKGTELEDICEELGGSSSRDGPNTSCADFNTPKASNASYGMPAPLLRGKSKNALRQRNKDLRRDSVIGVAETVQRTRQPTQDSGISAPSEFSECQTKGSLEAQLILHVSEGLKVENNAGSGAFWNSQEATGGVGDPSIFEDEVETGTMESSIASDETDRAQERLLALRRRLLASHGSKIQSKQMIETLSKLPSLTSEEGKQSLKSTLFNRRISCPEMRKNIPKKNGNY